VEKRRKTISLQQIAFPAWRAVNSVEGGGKDEKLQMVLPQTKDASTLVARLTTDQVTSARLANLFAAHFDGTDAAVSVVDSGQGRWQVAIHFQAVPDERRVRALTRAAAGERAAAGLAFERIAARDWIEESLAGLKPVPAGRFVVHGAHDRTRIAPNRIAIEIEAALAFGTGHHGTTRGCLLALDSICKARSGVPVHGRPSRRALDAGVGRAGRAPRILDLGTGSGVLAIAAARALRRRVLAVDIDADAVRIARANARLNGVAALIAAAQGNGVRGRREPFNLIFANILLEPLQRLAPALTRLVAPGGRIVLSGLLTSQANAARVAYHALALERRIDLNGWATLVLTRRIRTARSIARTRKDP
jgi:ribosomal protein L11 methyltransferase